MKSRNCQASLIEQEIARSRSVLINQINIGTWPEKRWQFAVSDKHWNQNSSSPIRVPGNGGSPFKCGVLCSKVIRRDNCDDVLGCIQSRLDIYNEIPAGCKIVHLHDYRVARAPQGLADPLCNYEVLIGVAYEKIFQFCQVINGIACIVALEPAWRRNS